MGKLVAFWSPYGGVAKVTSSLCAIAGSFGIQYPEMDVAICSALSDSFGPEEYLIECRSAEFFREVYKRAGIEDLKLHFRQEALSSEIIRRSAVSLKMKSLFLYPDSYAENTLDDIRFQLLTKTLKEEFSLVFLDVGNKDKKQRMRFLESADLIVVVLPQARRYREDFFTNKKILFGKKQFCILQSGYLGKYRTGETWYFREVRQDSDEMVGYIPMNTDFFYALEQGKTLEYFYRNQFAGKKEDNYEFIIQTKKAAERISKKLFLC